MANILIVDDDKALLEFLGARLSALGHACRAEADGLRALETIQRGGVDLVILDVMLPGLSGFEICRRVRLDPHFNTVLIIFLSSMNTEEEIRHGLAQGADDFMAKPFKFETLLQRVELLLGSRSAQQFADSATGLLGPKAIKFELGRVIQQHEPFGAAYVELLNLAEFGKVHGDEARAKALRHFARSLKLCGEEMKATLFEAGHLGGGHFIVLMDRKKIHAFARAVTELWDRHLPKLYAEVAQARGSDAPRTAASPSLDGLFCVTRCEPTGLLTPASVLETLNHLRATALERQGTGIYLDRRQGQSALSEL